MDSELTGWADPVARLCVVKQAMGDLVDQCEAWGLVLNEACAA